LTAPPTAAIEVRRLTYADLPQVVAIERRAFTTPWSLAMFVLELSKPSGVCLAA
jgi:[ribosomal protein S18]-alanine N-acetyltransferase